MGEGCVKRKKTEQTPLSDSRGVALLLTIGIMGALMVIMVAYLSMTETEMKTIGGQISNTQALYVGDSGLQYAIYRLHTDSNWDEDAGVTHVLGNGSFIVDTRDIAGGTPPEQYKRITVTGTVSGLDRLVKQDISVTP
ncbi:MAG: hypothetical protein ABH868_02610 [bacterium]